MLGVSTGFPICSQSKGYKSCDYYQHSDDSEQDQKLILYAISKDPIYGEA